MRERPRRARLAGPVQQVLVGLTHMGLARAPELTKEEGWSSQTTLTGTMPGLVPCQGCLLPVTIELLIIATTGDPCERIV